MIEIYTDGAASNNKTKCGGWAYAIYSEGGIVSGSGNEKDTTNNIMEMTAMLRAMEEAEIFGKNTDVVFYTDSAYIHNCFEKKWYVTWRNNGWINSKKEPVKNKELWESLLWRLERHPKWHIRKVQAHASDDRNNYVDSLAVEARKKIENA